MRSTFTDLHTRAAQVIKSGAVPVIHEALVADKFSACKVSQDMRQSLDGRVVLCTFYVTTLSLSDSPRLINFAAATLHLVQAAAAWALGQIGQHSTEHVVVRATWMACICA